MGTAGPAQAGRWSPLWRWGLAAGAYSSRPKRPSGGSQVDIYEKNFQVEAPRWGQAGHWGTVRVEMRPGGVRVNHGAQRPWRRWTVGTVKPYIIQNAISHDHKARYSMPLIRQRPENFPSRTA